MNTKVMPVSDLRNQAGAVMRGVKEDGDIVYITRHGRPAAVLIDYERYEALLAREQVALAQQDWPTGYFEETYGALADNPLPTPDELDYELRDAIA